LDHEINTFGVKEFSKSDSEVDTHVENILSLGYSIVPNVIDQKALDSIRGKLDSIYQTQVDECGGEDQLAIINDAHTVRCPLAYDDVFLDVARSESVLSIVGRLLGDYFVLMLQNGVLNIPDTGHNQNAGYWHRDLNYQHFVSSRPLAISALFVIDEFSELTGATCVLPASHKSEAFPSDAFVRANERTIEAPPGSALVFDSMMFHRGSRNRSGNPRRAINHIYSLPIIKQQISLPKILAGRFSDDPTLSIFLGYESESDDNVTAFRKKRIARIQNSHCDAK
jgi:ectoine hydroxylase-related dioxygenase (phytanoyl-CoA dioxygenase family)